MENNRCACCLKHVSELKPFGRGGYRFDGDFNGELLCETDRPIFPPNSLKDKVYEQFFGDCNTDEQYEKAKEAMIKSFGQEIAEEVIDYALGKSGSEWLCRKCVGLDWDEYLEKQRQAYLLKQHPTKVKKKV